MVTTRAHHHLTLPYVPRLDYIKVLPRHISFDTVCDRSPPPFLRQLILVAGQSRSVLFLAPGGWLGPPELGCM